MKVFVGLSGGVDSAVSAALLKQAGHDVTGVFIRITVPGYPCTAGVDRIDAMRVAAHLKIPFQEIDLSAEYKKAVFDTSIKAFARGDTPNPDVLCNREIKFGLFYQWARAQGADTVATGHYAQIKNGDLCMAADTNKDQTYFLALVPREVFAHTVFPIGHLQKPEVRALAEKFGLPVALRPDSQGLCFLGPISVSDMLRQEMSVVPGDVLDESGAVVGTHEGVQLYTLGQRHGFVVPSPVPLYVIEKNREANTITVSPSKFPRGATKTDLVLGEGNWFAEGGSSARYRYRQPLIKALRNGETVTLAEPHYAPVGQVLALYDGERCVGGGVIEKSRVY